MPLGLRLRSISTEARPDDIRCVALADRHGFRAVDTVGRIDMLTDSNLLLVDRFADVGFEGKAIGLVEVDFTSA